MKTTILHPVPRGTVSAIPSKSHVHRLLICAALSDRECTVRCTRTNDDIDATVRCLTALGADIKYDAGVFRIRPLVRGGEVKNAVLDCGESGSTFRFLLPVVCALGCGARFVLHGRLAERPLSPLYEELQRHGAVLSRMGENPFEVSGILSGGDFTFEGNISSQFTTGLLLALPLTGTDSRISLTGRIESRPYIDMTVDALSQFGIGISEYDGSFFVPSKALHSPTHAEAEGDWSNAAFMLVCGALSEEGVAVRGLKQDSRQGDRRILQLLSELGANCVVSGDTVYVSHASLHGCVIDAADIPDLVPIISVAASVAMGETVIKNCARLRLKESDRLVSTSTMLSRLGADISVLGDSLVIRGVKRLRGGVVPSFGDHRIAMSAAVAAIACDENVTIDGSEAVQKSYPDFFTELSSICGADSVRHSETDKEIQN